MIRHDTRTIRRQFSSTDRAAYCGLLFCCQLVVFPQVASAAGFWALDVGSESFARGGANFSAPSDPVALYSNPAALAGLRGLQLVIDANIVDDGKHFQRAPDDIDGDGEFTNYDLVENQAKVLPPSPGIFMAYNFANLAKKLGIKKHLDGLTIGFGVFGPPRADSVYAEDGPQRYSVIETHNLQVHYGLAVGYQLPWANLRIGGTFFIIDQIIDQRLRLNAPLVFLDENQSYDIDITLKTRSRPIPTGTLGLSIEPLRGLVLAFSTQLGWKVRSSGKADVVLGDAIGALAAVNGDEVDLDLNMPTILRTAVAYIDPQNRFDIELAFVYETWSVNDKQVLTPQDISLTALGQTLDLPVIELDANWQDAWSLRLGASFRGAPKWLELRAGLFYEKSPVPLEYLSPSSFELDKVGTTMGARIDLPLGIWMALAFGVVYSIPAEIDNSNVRFTNPIPDADGNTQSLWPIANGNYSNVLVHGKAALGVDLPF